MYDERWSNMISVELPNPAWAADLKDDESCG